MLDVDKHFFGRELGAVGHSLDDAQIGLMGHKVIYIVDRKMVAVHHVERRCEHVCHRMLVDIAAVLKKIMFAGGDSFRSGRLGGTARRHIKVFESVAIDMEYGVNNAYTFFFGSFDKHGGGAVAEKRTCGSVLIIYHRGHLFSTYNHHMLVHSRTDICCGVLQGDDESGTCGLYIVGIGIGQRAAVGYDGTGRRKTVVGV